MSCFLSNSSLGKKLVMSVTGCFLVLFILFHMSMNIVAIISPEAYNMICALLGANWYALAGTLVLAAGVVIHFIYAVILTLENRKARGSQRYAVTVVEPGVGRSPRNTTARRCRRSAKRRRLRRSPANSHGRPAGALAEKWSNHKAAIKVVSPANKRKLDIIIVGTGGCGR